MGLNKKAIFFTIIVISILSLFMVSYTVYDLFEDRESVNKRIETMNNFIFSSEENLERQLYISGFRIIFLFEKEIVKTGSYITDLDANFNEVFFEGSILGKRDEEIDSLMNGAKFSDIVEEINHDGEMVNVDVKISNPEISIGQDDPWNVKINFKADFYVNDKGDLASWNRFIDIFVYIPVESFEDPLYIAGTNGMITNKINRTTFTPGVSNLLEHVKNQNYIASTLAPSFLYRLQGFVNPNEYGIESLVYIPELSVQGLAIKEKSSVDYIYFSSSNPDSQNVAGMPSWFRLDEEHLDVYCKEFC